MEMTKNKIGAAFMRVLRLVVALPIAAVCYLAGSVLMLAYSLGGVVLSIGAFVMALGCLYSLCVHNFSEAALAAFAAWAFSPIGLPMIAMAAAGVLMGFANYLYQWGTKQSV